MPIEYQNIPYVPKEKKIVRNDNITLSDLFPAMKKMFDKGYTMIEIGKKFGMHRESVSSVFYRNGFSSVKQKKEKE